MPTVRTLAVGCDLVSPYGWGVDTCWEGLLSGRSAIRSFARLPQRSFPVAKAAFVADLDPDRDETMVMQMLKPLVERSQCAIPSDALLILATTNGEIDILERSLIEGAPSAEESCPDRLLRKVAASCGLSEPGMVLSAACASSSAAVARGATLIAGGERDCVLVVACDSVSEFLAAGFSSLKLIDPDAARPFDRNRAGLSLGEAAAFILLMSEERARREDRSVLAEVAGWGTSGDASHLTAPAMDGRGLALALRKALASASVSAEAVGSISAHGTGTFYNDSVEMRAFKSVFGERGVATYSLKGGIGHTMGSAGLVDIIVAIMTLQEQLLPPTVNLREVDDDALGWVSPEPRAWRGQTTVSTNSGFGGVNCAVVVKSADRLRSRRR